MGAALVYCRTRFVVGDITGNDVDFIPATEADILVSTWGETIVSPHSFYGEALMICRDELITLFNLKSLPEVRDLSVYRSYVGTGSRETPDEILRLMADLSLVYREKGFVLRTGQLAGAESAFQISLWKDKEIYAPGKDKNPCYFPIDYVPSELDVSASLSLSLSQCYPCKTATDFAAQCFDLSEYSLWLKQRIIQNVYLLLGKELNRRAHFLIYYAHEDEDNIAGISRYIIAQAKQMNIPTYNLFSVEIAVKFQEKVREWNRNILTQR